MRLVVDTGPLLSQAERDHEYRGRVREVLQRERDRPLMSPMIAQEVDYFLQRRGGPAGNRTFIMDLRDGRFEVPCLEPADYVRMAEVNQRYRDLNVGLADLSTVVVALKFDTTRILTFDQRHFRLIRPLQGGVFTLLPFDEDIE
jgi:predicted nucleic acid-binding protein